MDQQQPGRHRWRRWIDGHAFTLTLVFILLTAIGGVVAIRQEATERTRAVEATADASRDQVCEESRNFRRLVAEMIDAAVADTGSALPLTSVPAYDALPANIQRYLLELAAAAGATEGPNLAERLTTFRDDRLADLPPFCTEEHP